jgi:DTW domain-containing protein
MKCSNCRFDHSICLCHQVTPLSTNYRLSVVMNLSEFFKLSNSGRLLPLLFKNTQIFIRGLRHNPLRWPLQENHKPIEKAYILFPNQQALCVDDISIEKNANIIIPDGNWSQAAKITNRLLKIKGMQTITFKSTKGSRYLLRKNPDANRLCTLQASAILMAQLDRDATIEQNANKLLDRLNHNVMSLRGIKKICGAKRGT